MKYATEEERKEARRAARRKWEAKPSSREKKRQKYARYRAKPENKAKERAREQLPHIKAMRREYHRRGDVKERSKNAKLVRQYGITSEQHAAMLLTQQGLCALCEIALSTEVGIHTDHCHATGAVRGLLCRSCNAGLGMFDDDPVRLAKAIGYLLRFPATDKGLALEWARLIKEVLCT